MSKIKTINLFGVEVEIEYEHTPEVPPITTGQSGWDPGQSEEWEILRVDQPTGIWDGECLGENWNDLTEMNEANKDEIIRLLKT